MQGGGYVTCTKTLYEINICQPEQICPQLVRVGLEPSYCFVIFICVQMGKLN